MSRYRVVVPGWASFFATVEADSAHEATENAAPPYLCAQCAGYGQESGLEVSSDDWDWDKAEVYEVDGEGE